jgi:hypothetical protein
MKYILLFILFICSSNIIKAQDTLSTRYGESILVKVIEVGTSEVKYKKLDNLNGPIFSMLKSDLLMIKYENGTRVDLNTKIKYVIKSNPRLSSPFGININLFGQTEYLSLSVDYFVTSSLDIEVGTGFYGTFGGLKYHFFGAKNDKNWTPYLGVYLARIPHIIDSEGSTTHVYIPLGIQLHKNNGRTFGVELAYRSFSNYNSYIPAFKFGYHF